MDVSCVRMAVAGKVMKIQKWWREMLRNVSCHIEVLQLYWLSREKKVAKNLLAKMNHKMVTACKSFLCWGFYYYKKGDYEYIQILGGSEH